jgi:hypothetical protein
MKEVDANKRLSRKGRLGRVFPEANPAKFRHSKSSPSLIDIILIIPHKYPSPPVLPPTTIDPAL